MSTLSENIKRYRENQNMTQDELGELLLVSGKTISSWEKGRSEPKIDMIEKLGKIFHCSSSHLIGEKENDFFTSPHEALEFILKQEMFAQFGGYDLDTMSDEEIIDMANDIAQFIKMIAKRHR
ncbi:MAG: helix-turn-helix domain-containing protein [Longibaculum sp.]